MNKVKTSIETGDLIKLVESVDGLDSVTMNLHPSAPIFRASAILGMYDQNTISPDQNEKALDELRGYIEDARRRNPYNVEADFYEGEYFVRVGDRDKAREAFAKALDYDPTYSSARVKLFPLMRDPGQAYAMLKEGLIYEYWQQNPQRFYGLVYIEAQKRQDMNVVAKVQARLNSLYSEK